MDKLQLLFITGLVLPATGLVNGRWQFSTSYNIHKIVTGNYLGGPYSCGKFGANPYMWASRQMGEIYRFFTYLYLFSGTRLQVRPLGGF